MSKHNAGNVLSQHSTQQNDKSRKVRFNSVWVGSLSGACSTIVLQPLDLIKTRLQTAREVDPSAAKLGLVKTTSNVIRGEGYPALWKGLTPSLVRTVPGVGLYFGCLYNLQELLSCESPSAFQAFCLAAVSRSIAGVVLLPATVIKTRYESTKYAYGSVYGALRSVYTNEGFRGLFSGLSATLLRDAPFSGMYYLFYSQSKKVLPENDITKQWRPSVNFCRGIIAGVMASVISQPADMTKTYMQLDPKKHSTLWNTVQYILRTEGIPGLFHGMLPRCLRRTLMSALSWTIFEAVYDRFQQQR